MGLEIDRERDPGLFSSRYPVANERESSEELYDGGSDSDREDGQAPAAGWQQGVGCEDAHEDKDDQGRPQQPEAEEPHQNISNSQQAPVGSASARIEESIRAVALGMCPSAQQDAMYGGEATDVSPLQPSKHFRAPKHWRVDASIREAALSSSMHNNGPLPTNLSSRISMAHAAPKTLRLRDLQTKQLPKLIAWSVDEWKGLLNGPSVERCLLEVTAAHRLIFKRDLNELSRIRRPPPSVGLVMEAVVILLGYTPRVTHPPKQLPPFRTGDGVPDRPAKTASAVGRARGDGEPLPLPRGTECVDYSEAVGAILRDPLRLSKEIDRETPPRVTAAKVRALGKLMTRTSFGKLKLSQLPSVNGSLALYYWAVATINYCFAKAALSTSRPVANGRSE